MSVIAAPESIGGSPEALVTTEAFKSLFRTVPSAVSIMAVRTEEGIHATTVSAFTSLSVDPPMVMLAMDRRSSLLAAMREHGHFSMNILAHHQAEQALMGAAKGTDTLPADQWTLHGGSPRLLDALAWASCRVEQILGGGDHEIILGAILDCDAIDGEPLVYHDRAFHRLQPAGTEGIAPMVPRQ